MAETFYDSKTKTLIFSFNFNKELKDLPLDMENIIFKENYDELEYSIFNQQVDATRKNLFLLARQKTTLFLMATIYQII